jgi:hypothetical protein
MVHAVLCNSVQEGRPGARIRLDTDLLRAEVARLPVFSPPQQETPAPGVPRGPNLSSCDGTQTAPSRASRLRDDAGGHGRARPWGRFVSTPRNARRTSKTRTVHLYRNFRSSPYGQIIGTKTITCEAGNLDVIRRPGLG